MIPSCGIHMPNGSCFHAAGVTWNPYKNMTWHTLSNGERWRQNSCCCCRKQSDRDWIKVSRKGPLDGLLFFPIQVDVSLSCQKGITAVWFINTPVTLQPPEDESAAPPLFEILLNAQKLSTFWVCMPSGTSAKEDARRSEFACGFLWDLQNTQSKKEKKMKEQQFLHSIILAMNILSFIHSC